MMFTYVTIMPLATATVDVSGIGRTVPFGYQGYSMEYADMPNFVGKVSTNLNTTFISLLKLLNKGNGAATLRIGGNSTDTTLYNNDPLAARPAGITYLLRDDHLTMLDEVARQTTARVIPGINFGRATTAQSVEMMRAITNVLGARISFYELGNEPDLYGGNRTRATGYAYAQYKAEISQRLDEIQAAYGGTLPPMMAPAFSQGSWMADNIQDIMNSFAADLRAISYHRYPLNACGINSTTPADRLPTIPKLLSPESSELYVDRIAAIQNVINPSGKGLYFTELNSIACGGYAGVSDTFASCLWGLDIMFELVMARARGINVHTGTDSPYHPFTFKGSDPTAPNGGRFDAKIRPLFYAQLAFAEASANKAKVVPVSLTKDAGLNLKIWSTLEPSGLTKTYIINKSDQSGQVDIRHSTPKAAGTFGYLTAPSVYHKADPTIADLDQQLNVTYYGQKVSKKGVIFGDRVEDEVTSVNGTFGITVQPYEIVILKA